MTLAEASTPERRYWLTAQRDRMLIPNPGRHQLDDGLGQLHLQHLAIGDLGPAWVAVVLVPLLGDVAVRNVDLVGEVLGDHEGLAGQGMVRAMIRISSSRNRISDRVADLCGVPEVTAMSRLRSTRAVRGRWVASATTSMSMSGSLSWKARMKRGSQR